ncbi:MAG TPA: HAMP domain-containing sensor histidine kinase [bacterium]|nr:HAMP domain-containing sensor histidine kinase [bacterium]
MSRTVLAIEDPQGSRRVSGARVIAGFQVATAGLIRRVARTPVSVHTKLLAAFLAMAALLLALGIVALQTLSAANRRAEEVRSLQLKADTYREFQRDALAQNDGVTRALTVTDDRAAPDNQAISAPQMERVARAAGLDALLHAAVQFHEDLGQGPNGLAFSPPVRQEGYWLSQIRARDAEFVAMVSHGVALIRQGNVTVGRRQLLQAAPLADQLESATGQLVVVTDADIAARLRQSRAAYALSQRLVTGFAAGSIALALFLGYVISWSLIGPVRRIDAQLKLIASGDFSHHVDVDNGDELGGLARNLNRMTNDLDRLYQQLAAANRHKSQFLANMSHELRTPLNAILGYTELILDDIYGEIPGKVRDALERVQKSGRHLLGLINDVLDLSKIEAGRLTLTLDDYSMTDIVRNVSAAVEALVAEKRLHFTVAVPPDLPRGHGDERRLTQVLLNLVGNAIKFTDAGEVAIRAAVRDGQFVVAVADTGPGIAEQDRQKIFEEFQQADDSNTRRRGGTGLGLSIAKRIVELHRGRLWVESSPGQGSTFWFAIPVLVEPSAS